MQLAIWDKREIVSLFFFEKNRIEVIHLAGVEINRT